MELDNVICKMAIFSRNVLTSLVNYPQVKLEVS